MPVKTHSETISKLNEPTHDHNESFNEFNEHIIELNVVTVAPFKRFPRINEHVPHLLL